MKRVLPILLFFCTVILMAGEENISLPPLEEWNKEDSASIRKTGESIIPLGGSFTTPASYPGKYGDTVRVTVLFSGKGSVQFRLIELDGKGKCIARNFKALVNPGDAVHSRSLYLSVSGKTAERFKLAVLSKSNAGLGIRKIDCVRLFGKENELYSPYLNRKLWSERTAGKNLALGRTVKFFPEPAYKLTKKNDTDAADLTDGKLSTKYGDYIWFDPAAVGWSTWEKRCLVSIDLGSVCSISKAVVRVCGGRFDALNGYGMFPDLFEVWVSRDGKDWYPASSLKKVQINEMADADWKSLYYLPEIQRGDAPVYMYPFELAVNAEARYIAIGFTKQNTSLYLDEIAVMEGDAGQADFNAAYAREPDRVLFSREAAVVPFYPEIYVPRGDIQLPNLFKLDDRRKVKDMNLSYFIDLPEQVSYTESQGWPAFTRELVRTETRNGRTIRYFNIRNESKKLQEILRRYHIGPFFFRAEKEVPAGEMYVRIGTTSGKKKQETVIRKYKLNVITVPKVPRMEHLQLSLAWFTSRVTAFWPDFGKTVRHVGIGSVGLHFSIRPDRKDAFLKELRQYGIKTVGIPRTSISKLVGKDTEHLCITPTGGAKNKICPAYRGKYYEQFCREIARDFSDNPVDCAHLDYELWFSPEAFKQCSRCDALRKSNNLTWADYAPWAMADFYRGILQAVRKAQPKIPIGSYLFCLDRTQSVDGRKFIFFGTDRLFPEYLDEVQTPYYGPNPVLVAARVRANYLKIRNPAKITAYLTAGAGAYGTDRMYDRVKWELLEAFMNGAYCIAYYIDTSFTSPLDYLYLVEGAKAVAPHEKFLMKAELDPDFKGSDPSLCYTCRKLGDKALILTGNYGTSKAARTLLPLKNAVSAKDCFTGKEIPVGAEGIELNVPGGKAAFIEVGFR